MWMMLVLFQLACGAEVKEINFSSEETCTAAMPAVRAAYPQTNPTVMCVKK